MSPHRLSNYLLRCPGHAVRNPVRPQRRHACEVTSLTTTVPNPGSAVKIVLPFSTAPLQKGQKEFMIFSLFSNRFQNDRNPADLPNPVPGTLTRQFGIQVGKYFPAEPMLLQIIPFLKGYFFICPVFDLVKKHFYLGNRIFFAARQCERV